MTNDRVNGIVREAMVAGLFYPEAGPELLWAVDSALEAAEATSHTATPAPAAAARCILSPHGGFTYSSLAQAKAWRELKGRSPSRVVVLGPWHGANEQGVFLPESNVFRTPLGDLRVDDEICDELESSGTVFVRNDIPHMEEHSIELQLPFMKRLFPDALLIPILVGGHDRRLPASLSRALDLTIEEYGDSMAVVASSNLSSSFKPDEAEARSDRIIEALERGDAEALANDEGREMGFGSAVLAAVVGLHCMRDLGFRLLKRIDSIKARGDEHERIVHYAAGAWYPKEG
jgi:AmmeMemoRadiSam system protein B